MASSSACAATRQSWHAGGNAGVGRRSTAEVASNITEVNRGAGDTGSASARVLSSAQSLSRQSTRLRAEIERFLQMVRAA